MSLPRTWKTCADEGTALYKCCNFLKSEELFVESLRRARNEDVAPQFLAQALNNLAIAYGARAKYQDAENLLNEARRLPAENAESRLQRALTLHVLSDLLLEQEQHQRAFEIIDEAVEFLTGDLKPYSREFYITAFRLHLALAHDLQAAKELAKAREISVDPKLIYNDDAGGRTLFGPGWAVDDDSSKLDADLEHQLLFLMLELVLKNHLPTHSKKLLQDSTTLLEKAGDHRLKAMILNHAKQLSFFSSDWAEGAKYCKEALDMAIRIFGEDHPAIVPYLYATSLTILTDGLPDCVYLMEKTLEIVSSTFGVRHPKFARYQLAWSALLPFINPENTAISEQQEQLLTEALETLLDFFDDAHTLVAGVRIQLAETYIKLDKYSEAEALLTKVREHATPGGVDNPVPIMSYISMMSHLCGSVSRSERNRLMVPVGEELAKVDFEKIENIGRRIDMVCKVAYLHRQLLEFEQCELLLRQACELSKPIDPELYQRAKQDLCSVLLDNDKSEEALPLLSESTNLSDSQRLKDKVQLARVLCSLERRKEAETVALEALSETERLLPQNNDTFIQLSAVLIDQYITEDRLEDATRMIGSVTNQRKHLGLAIMDIIPVSLRMVADGYARKGDRRAESLYKQAIAAAEEVIGKSPGTMDTCLLAFADYLLNSGQLDKAKKQYDRWIEFRKEVCGEDTFSYAAAILNVAEVHMHSDNNRALALSKQGLSILDKLTDVDEHYLVAALQLRVAILEKSNLHDEAAQLIARVKNMEEKELSE